MKDVTKQPCDRGDDLIAFLYRELDEKDARNFEQHLHQCASCERELSSFGEIRESIISWRDASLGTFARQDAQDDRQATFAVPTRRSALAAIREFFNLSPLWMKGAAAFASLLFCVCAVLAIAYLKKPSAPTIVVSTEKAHSQAELDKQVAAAVQASERRLRSELAISVNPAKRPADQPASPVSPKRPVNRAPQLRESTYAINNLRKPLTARERKELAADLGLLTSRDDDDLDLVTDKIPQTP